MRVVGGRLTESFATLVNPGRRIPPFVVRANRHHRRDGGRRAADRRGPAALPRVRRRRRRWWRTTPASTSAHLNAAPRCARPGRPLDVARALHAPARAPADARAPPPLARLRRRRARHRVLRPAPRPPRRAHRRRDPVRLPRAGGGAGHRRGSTSCSTSSAAPSTGGRSWCTSRALALDDVPVTPGVYHLLGERRAAPLRRQGGAGCASGSASYFANARGHSRARARADPAGATTSASPRRARSWRRRCSRRGTSASCGRPTTGSGSTCRGSAFLKVGVRSPFPRLSVTQRLGADRAVYVGPFREPRGRRARADGARAPLRAPHLRRRGSTPSPEVVAVSLGAGRARAPRRARRASTRARTGRRSTSCLAFLDGDGRRAGATAARRDASPPRCASRRPRARSATSSCSTSIRRRRRRWRGSWRGRTSSSCCRRLERDAAQLYAVLGGRLALEARITAAADLLGGGRARARALRALPGRAARRATTSTGRRSIAAWLRDRGASEGMLLPLDGPDALVERLDELVVTVRDLRLPRSAPGDRRPRVSAPPAGRQRRRFRRRAGGERRHRPRAPRRHPHQHEPDGDGRRGGAGRRAGARASAARRRPASRPGAGRGRRRRPADIPHLVARGGRVRATQPVLAGLRLRVALASRRGRARAAAGDRGAARGVRRAPGSRWRTSTGT